MRQSIKWTPTKLSKRHLTWIVVHFFNHASMLHTWFNHLMHNQTHFVTSLISKEQCWFLLAYVAFLHYAPAHLADNVGNIKPLVLVFEALSAFWVTYLQSCFMFVGFIIYCDGKKSRVGYTFSLGYTCLCICFSQRLLFTIYEMPSKCL